MAPDWGAVWRDGFMPQLDALGLDALAEALEADDPQLIQGASCQARGGAITGCCPVGYAFWQARRRRGRRVRRPYVEARLGVAAAGVDERFGLVGAGRFFFVWWDNALRAEARVALLGMMKGVSPTEG